MSDITRKANVDAKRSVRDLVERFERDGLSKREVAAAMRRMAKRHELSFDRRAVADDYGRTFDAVAMHEAKAIEEHYRRVYRAEEAAQ